MDLGIMGCHRLSRASHPVRTCFPRLSIKAVGFPPSCPVARFFIFVLERVAEFFFSSVGTLVLVDVCLEHLLGRYSW